MRCIIVHEIPDHALRMEDLCLGVMSWFQYDNAYTCDKCGVVYPEDLAKAVCLPEPG